MTNKNQAQTTITKVPFKDLGLQFLGPTNHQWVEISKKQAEMLINNYKISKHLNRTPSEDRIEQYIKDMDSKNWKEIDVSAVLIDADGVLRGGLHRMIALTRSGQDKIKFPVIYPASEEEIKRQDTNKARTQVDSDNMAMSKATHEAIQAFENLSERTIHTAGKILCLADDHPGLNTKNKTNFATKGEKRSFIYSHDAVVKSIEKYLAILGEVDEHGFPFGDSLPEGHVNYARFAPFVAAFTKAYSTMDKIVWKKLVRTLTIQENQFDQVNSPNKYLASEALMDVYVSKTEQNNPLKVDQDLRRVLSCLAAAHNDVNVKNIDFEKYGYETFLK